MVNLIFGEKTPRDKSLGNPHLSDVYRSNRSDYSIFIQSSSWLLEKNDQEVCSSESDNSNSGPMVTGLANLLSLHVRHIEYIAEQGLYIDFQNDYTLSIFFGDEEPQDEELDYLTIYCPGSNITINTANQIETNKNG